MKYLSLLAFLFSSSFLYANPTITGKINFAGGVNYQDDPKEIQDVQAADMSNMVSYKFGTVETRYGSKRFNSTALSTNPITGIFKGYAKTLINTSTAAIIFTSRDKIYTTTGGVSPIIVAVSSGLLTNNQKFNFTQMNNDVYLTGDALTDPVFKYDILRSSISSLFDLVAGTNSITPRAKYLLDSRNYLLLANTVVNSTHFPSRIYYSQLFKASSVTADRFISVKEDDGEEITGIGQMRGLVNIFKPTSIHELSFTVLNPGSGDQVLSPIVQGFGCIAPRTLANIGDYYIFLSKQGIIQWDGANRNRLDIEQERLDISRDIKPIIDRMINAGTYKNAIGFFYPKLNWYIFCYEDPLRLPNGKNNSVMVYDLTLKQWFPIKNWLVDSITSFDSIQDKGELLYGDSNDGYIHFANVQDIEYRDSRKEISVDPMDIETNWTRGTQSTFYSAEGTGSIRLPILTSTVLISSMAKMDVFRVGDYYDGTKVERSKDLLSFKVLVTSHVNLTSIRVDLEMNDVKSDFDGEFTSVTLTSSLFNATTQWVRIEIVLSSFPLKSNWIDISSESLTFADTLTYYGIRFVANASAGCAVYIDDIRIVQDKANPINPFRLTKEFNLNTDALKRYRQIYLNIDMPSDSDMFIDVYGDFGSLLNQILVDGGFNKTISVASFQNSTGVSILNKSDFSLIDSTVPYSRESFAFRPITEDEDFIYAGDHFNNRIFKIAKSTLQANAVEGTFGSLGSGATNFNTIYQIWVDDDNLFVCDFGNNRIKKHDKDGFEFLGSYGELGKGTTNLHNPTGISGDNDRIYVGNDGNHNIVILNKSTFGYIGEVILDHNTIGDTTLSATNNFLFVAFNRLADNDFENQEVYLEKRNKDRNLSLIKRVKLRPRNISEISLSSYAIMGDICTDDLYVYVSFTSDVNGNGRYYIQKRLQSDLSIVQEYSSTARHFAVSTNSLSFKPSARTVVKDIGTEGNYIQFKFYSIGLDDSFKLSNLSMSLIPENFRER